MDEIDSVLVRFVPTTNQQGWLLHVARTTYDGHPCLLAEVSTQSSNLRVTAYNTDAETACRTAIGKMAQLQRVKV